MDKYENTFHLRLYQNENPQLIKRYIQELCDKLTQRNMDFHMDLYLDNMFQDEVYDGGRGPNTTYPYVRFEKAFDDMGSYFSFDTSKLMKSTSYTSPIVDLQGEILSTVDDTDEPSHKVSLCSELLAKIPDDIENEIVFEVKIKTNTPQLYRNGGIVQLEYLLQNV